MSTGSLKNFCGTMTGPDGFPIRDSLDGIVLVAEDDTATRKIIGAWLERLGYRTILAEDGREAWEVLDREIPPKLVLLDWTMPGIDGIELCRRLRCKEHAYYPYILMMAGRRDSYDVALALESGADDYLAKPFEEADLKARLRVAKRILGLQDSLIEAREGFRIQAMKDPLTDLWSRTAFLEFLEREMNRAARSKAKTGLLFVDIDHFKKINDTYGHLAGDTVLKDVAHCLKRCVRSYDFVGRYGGEEFCIALSECSGRHLAQRAEAIRQTVAAATTKIAGAEIAVTISIGATEVWSGATTPLAISLAIADNALYRAKSAGRNCTVLCTAARADNAAPYSNRMTRCSDCEQLASGKCIVRLGKAQA